jgi:hypothetical protein
MNGSKMKKNPSPQTDLFPASNELCADFAGADTYKKRVQAAARFCAERHKIYLKKSLGRPKPWTTDPILANYRFCNIYRELDKVTVQIMDDWIDPNIDNPNIACLALVGRLINHPDTLNKMLDQGFDFSRKPNPERLFRLFADIQKTKGTKLVTGAYICNTVFPRSHVKVDGTKGDYLANFFVPILWEHRSQLSDALASNSFSTMIEAFKDVHGIGPFIANQAAVDLTYTKHLNRAKDVDTTWNPGPGTLKGIRWITGDKTLNAGRKATDEALTEYRDLLNEELSKHSLFSRNMKDMKTNIVPVTGPNGSNSLCELAKIVWMALGLRDRLKNGYKGT